MLTGLVLPVFSSYIGLETKELYALACLPLAFSIYSFSCFGWVSTIKPSMLIGIVVGTIVYCLVSGALIFFQHGLGRQREPSTPQRSEPARFRCAAHEAR